MKKNEFLAEPVLCSVRPFSFCQEFCIDYNQCAFACQVSIMIPSPEEGERPIVMYPGECYYCGSCIMAYPIEGVIRSRHPLMSQAKFV